MKELMKADTQRQILDAGREEFLAKGFQDASLRRIAQEAGVTTGAIYGYYADKAALFQALVEPAAGDFLARFEAVQAEFTHLDPAAQIEQMRHYSNDALQSLLDDVYANLDAFRLIVRSSAGTAYAHFVDTLVEREAESTKAFIAVMQGQGHPVDTMPDNLYHILASAYFTAVFETVAHDMDKAEADDYVSRLTTFFQAGWASLMRL